MGEEGGEGGSSRVLGVERDLGSDCNKKTMTKARLERRKIREDEIKTRFTTGMHHRNLSPSPNPGGGNCAFSSLSEIVFGDASKFDVLR